MEHQLGRLQNPPPPLHLIDLGIMQLGENQGRERRYKYFTFANYQTVAEREKLDAAVSPEELAKAGDFMEVDEKHFYANEEEFNHYVDNFPLDGIFTPSIKEGKQKKKKRTNPILPDGSVKKGRPRKGDMTRETKRKRDEDEGEVAVTGDGASASASATGVSSPPKRKRGRPSKNRPADDTGPSAAAEEEVVADTLAVPSSATPAPEKRGRPPKASLEVPNTPTPMPRKRGRLPKKPEDVVAVDDVFTPEAPPTGAREEDCGLPDDIVNKAARPAAPAHAETSEVPQIADVPAPSLGEQVSQEVLGSTTLSDTPVRRSGRSRKPTTRGGSPVTTPTRSSRQTVALKAATGSVNQETTIGTGREDAEMTERVPTSVQEATKSVVEARSASVQPSGAAAERVDLSSPTITNFSLSHAVVSRNVYSSTRRSNVKRM